MKALLQRVAEADVAVNGRQTGSIGKGVLVFFCAEKGDTEKDLEFIARKISRLRIFSDEQGKMNLSAIDIAGEVLVVPQFTLAADCRKGNRPSFDAAAEPSDAEELYRGIVRRLKAEGLHVMTGAFAADMRVSLVNDGPVTVLVDSRR